MDWILSLLLATVRLAIPVLLISLAELYGQRAGMVNIGLEGLASIGALVGFLVCYVTGSNWLGLLCGALAGILVNMIYAFSTVTLCADHTVYGMAVNIFAPALASFIYRVYFGTGSDLKQITTMASIAIPGLKDIPVIGPLLFDQSPMVYLTFVLVIVTAVFFGKTRAGLSYKSVGEHPQAAATLGINVIGVKYLACVICGALAGIGGAYLTTCYSSTYTDGRRHLRPLERGRHSACLPVLRLLRRAADPSAGVRHRHPLSVLPDDPLRGDSRRPEPHRHAAGGPQGQRQALPPRAAVNAGAPVQ